MCSGRGVLVAHTWQPRKESFLLSDAKRVAKAETPTALSLARWFLVNRCPEYFLLLIFCF